MGAFLIIRQTRTTAPLLLELRCRLQPNQPNHPSSFDLRPAWSRAAFAMPSPCHSAASGRIKPLRAHDIRFAPMTGICPENLSLSQPIRKADWPSFRQTRRRCRTSHRWPCETPGVRLQQSTYFACLVTHRLEAKVRSPPSKRTIPSPSLPANLEVRHKTKLCLHMSPDRFVSMIIFSSSIASASPK